MGYRKQFQENVQKRNHYTHQSKAIDCTAELESLERVIIFYTQEIKDIESQLCKLAKNDVKIVSSIPGISLKGAAVIGIMLGDISRFKSIKQVVAFSGLDPKIQESGTSVDKKGRISKKGNATLRGALCQSGWYIYMQAIKGKGEKIFVDLVQRLKEKGLHYHFSA